MFYSKSQWARWLNGGSAPPRKAVHKLAGCLSREGVDASRLIELWDQAFAGPEGPTAATGYVVPRQLPSPVGHFVGRTDELATLIALAGEIDASTGPVVRVLQGTAGVGKPNPGANTSNRYPA